MLLKYFGIKNSRSIIGY